MKEVDIEGIKIQFKSMTMYTWSTMANSQQKSDKIDSNTIIRVNENASVR